ncbi:basic salivary proline-rich protein 1-like [Falco naumanni]|uniref:basic salivary proline-rich protein 1-like n=1 Tax=Falco naumanni TaxID=148594 RepID=UPI001ADE5BF7|nr:basic salivary proline-rich protein 1-like [Falco naumanni]
MNEHSGHTQGLTTLALPRGEENSSSRAPPAPQPAGPAPERCVRPQPRSRQGSRRAAARLCGRQLNGFVTLRFPCRPILGAGGAPGSPATPLPGRRGASYPGCLSAGQRGAGPSPRQRLCVPHRPDTPAGVTAPRHGGPRPPRLNPGVRTGLSAPSGARPSLRPPQHGGNPRGRAPHGGKDSRVAARLGDTPVGRAQRRAAARAARAGPKPRGKAHASPGRFLARTQGRPGRPPPPGTGLPPHLPAPSPAAGTCRRPRRPPPAAPARCPAAGGSRPPRPPPRRDPAPLTSAAPLRSPPRLGGPLGAPAQRRRPRDAQVFYSLEMERNRMSEKSDVP